MRGIKLMVLPLLGIGLVGCLPENQLDNDLPQNLKQRLDWISVVSKAMENNADVYRKLVSKVVMNIRAHISSVENDFYQFIREFAKFRDSLLNEPISQERIKLEYDSDEDEDDDEEDAIVAIILGDVFTIYDDLQELSAKAKEWLNKQPVPISPIKITDAEAVVWFKQKGFTEGSLKNVTVEAMNNDLIQLLDKDQHLGKMMTMLCTYMLLSYDGNVVDKLGWLLIFSSMIRTQNSIKEEMKKKLQVETPGDTEELMGLLVNLSSDNGPIMNLIGPSSDITLPKTYFEFIKNANFILPIVDVYMKGLRHICNDLTLRLNNMVLNLKSKYEHSQWDGARDMLMYNGFVLRKDDVDIPNFITQLRNLIDENGLLNKLEKFVTGQSFSHFDNYGKLDESSFSNYGLFVSVASLLVVGI